jgi:CRISPR/Cas system CMR-associated protein Cmr5 small subunit
LISNQDNLYDLLKSNTFVQNYVIEKIKNCTDEEILISTQMIREALSSQISPDAVVKSTQNPTSNAASLSPRERK